MPSPKQKRGMMSEPKHNLGPDAPVVENEHGGRQSDTGLRLDLNDPAAWMALGRVLHQGAEKYGVDNWRKIGTRSHLNHVLVHIAAYLQGDTQDDHLEHAHCRMMMALAMELQGGVEERPLRCAKPECVAPLFRNGGLLECSVHGNVGTRQ